MDAVPEEVGDLVMAVAFGDAVVSADVLGIQTADDHFFVLGHRQQRPGLLRADASGDEQQDNERCNCSAVHGHTSLSNNAFLVCTIHAEHNQNT
jgi:hypothetical protein